MTCVKRMIFLSLLSLSWFVSRNSFGGVKAFTVTTISCGKNRLSRTEIRQEQSPSFSIDEGMIGEKVDRRQFLQGPASAIVGVLASTTLLPETALSYSGPTIDVNNALAREYTAFPGLYPTIATKIVLGAKERGPYKSKAEVYAVLDSDAQRDRLREYDAAILISKPDANIRQFKESQICKYECGGRVSNSYRDEQIRQVQSARKGI